MVVVSLFFSFCPFPCLRYPFVEHRSSDSPALTDVEERSLTHSGSRQQVIVLMSMFHCLVMSDFSLSLSLFSLFSFQNIRVQDVS